jgi:hypothetical protein
VEAVGGEVGGRPPLMAMSSVGAVTGRGRGEAARVGGGALKGERGGDAGR